MSEHMNYFVSSRGLLKSCDYFSLEPRSSIRQLINYPDFNSIKNTNNTNSIKNPTIYVCSSAIPHFINAMLALIDFKFILVSGDCDETIPIEIFLERDFNKFLDDMRLVHWFSQNMVARHEKITIMPIGLDYHTMTSRTIWGPITPCLDQERILENIIKNSRPFYERTCKCYANYHFSMNTRHAYDRQDALKDIPRDLVFYEVSQVNRLITWNRQKDYAFVISPHGGGLDCHRTWEALALACIPIVKTSQIDDLFLDLPVLIVREWSDITQELLDKTVQDFKYRHNNNEFNYKKLSLAWWLNRINSYKNI